MNLVNKLKIIRFLKN